MLLSTEYKFIYIKIPKTGSTSTTSILSKYADRRISDHINRFFHPRTPPFNFGPSASSRKIRGLVGFSLWEQYFTFAFIRNPWEHVVSYLNHCIYKNCRPPFHTLKKIDNKQKQLSVFIDICLTHINDPNIHLYPQTNLITDSHNNLILDFVGKYENLSSDFDYACEKIGIPKTVLPRENTSPHKYNYIEYYTSETRKIVTKLRQKDIAFGNYKFGD